MDQQFYAETGFPLTTSGRRSLLICEVQFPQIRAPTWSNANVQNPVCLVLIRSETALNALPGQSDPIFSLVFYLQRVSVTGAGPQDPEAPQLASQQSQHGAVDVVQTDAGGAEGQTGALHLQDSLVQLGLGGAESGGGTVGRTQRCSESVTPLGTKL